MKKTFIPLVIIMVIAVLLHVTTDEKQVYLELYRQAGQGKAQLVGRIDDERVAEYQHYYRQRMVEGRPEGDPETQRYPDVAVYVIDGGSVVHHSSLWFWENGEGLMAFVEEGHRTKALSVDKVEEIKNIMAPVIENP